MLKHWCGAVIDDSNTRDYSRVPGIYALVHIPTERGYVGFTSRLHQRRQGHLHMLRCRTHGNHGMRGLAERSRGPADFVFLVLAMFARDEWWSATFEESAAIVANEPRTTNLDIKEPWTPGLAEHREWFPREYHARRLLGLDFPAPPSQETPAP